MSLIRSAQLNGHDRHAYLKSILTRRPTHKASNIPALLPHRWHSPEAVLAQSVKAGLPLAYAAPRAKQGE
jgi:IS66 C-terminal element